LKLDGSESVDLTGVVAGLKPGMDVGCRITRADGSVETVALLCRIDTLDEIEYFRNGGILQYVLRGMVKAA
jgi:aconitate hydratase